MKIVIIGGGKTGTYLARTLADEKQNLIIIDKNKEVVGKLREMGFKAYALDACDPIQLSQTEIMNADVAAVVTGHDEDNLVISNLLKKIFNVKRVVARINHPLNEWIFTDQWGVDIGVSSTHIISDLLLEEMRLRKAIEILKIKGGTVSVVEVTLDSQSRLSGKKISEVKLPPNSLIITVIRDGRFIVPDGNFVLSAGDEILAITSAENEKELAEVLES
ncbi:MAG: TrkA family potassium uptake protein [Actinobacteria bacterium]|nr:TrkA family potassium uptake protein [Actinomycetota bacterium]